MTRHCGNCTLCCKLIPVEEIGKPAGVRCRHVKSGKGCMIYARRPLSCREWSCMWLKGVEDDEPVALSRPDRVHYVIDEVPDIVRATNNVTGEVTQIDVMQIWVDPKFPDAWKDPALLAMLERVGIIGLVRYNSDRGFTIWPPSRNSTGKWQFTPTQSAEDLRGAQRVARHEFWTRQLQSQTEKENHQSETLSSRAGKDQEPRNEETNRAGREPRRAARSLGLR